MDCAEARDLLPLASDETALYARTRETLGAHLDACPACREAAEKSARLVSALDDALGWAAPAPGLVAEVREGMRPLRPPAPSRRRRPRRARPSRARRPLPWGVAIAVAAAAAVLIFVLVPKREADRPKIAVAAGVLYGAGGKIAKLEPGGRYETRESGARLAAGVGSIDVARESAFRLTGGGLALEEGELYGRNVRHLSVETSRLRAELAAASFALARSGDGDEEAALVVLAGRASATAAGGESVEVARGRVLAVGWGVGEHPIPVAALAAELVERRDALAEASLTGKYREIVKQYTARLAVFDREMKRLDPASPQARELAARRDSLAECLAMHAKRVPALERDAAERVRVAERLAFLDRAGQWDAGTLDVVKILAAGLQPVREGWQVAAAWVAGLVQTEEGKGGGKKSCGS